MLHSFYKKFSWAGEISAGPVEFGSRWPGWLVGKKSQFLTLSPNEKASTKLHR